MFHLRGGQSMILCERQRVGVVERFSAQNATQRGSHCQRCQAHVYRPRLSHKAAAHNENAGTIPPNGIGPEYADK